MLPALVAKEFQTWLRGRLTFAAFGAVVVSLSVLLFLLALLILAPDANAAPALLPTSTTTTTTTNLLVTERGLIFFGAVGVCLLLAAAVIAPAVSASAFAGERDQGTLDLLLLHGPGPGRVVLGKVVAALLFSLLVLLVAAPLVAPVWSFGGVRLEHWVAFGAVLLAATLLFTALGVFFGAVFQGALTAALFAQAAALLLLFGTAGLHLAAWGLAGSDLFKPLLWLNPFLALFSGGGSVTEAFARFAPSALRDVVALPAATWLPGAVVPAWVIASVLWTAAAAALAALTAVVIDPCHPLKVRRS